MTPAKLCSDVVTVMVELTKVDSFCEDKSINKQDDETMVDKTIITLHGNNRMDDAGQKLISLFHLFHA